ncbi:sirohydrochlorin chelatase [Gracilibacillus sp. S3-1-1]|uniref:Sirohydrochlorin chelatase n=1 Tax=Gracilibacillus pellucidus TaxID=3095368 RepID=A0ACC6M1M3_9BACI|nr:sirohydrochlorin chelatase [Gracilibacillus sp. S3-1-1]MDX8044823.1 sirohydrochlorin chelatase [Gracilibacillus sp. S3-1-1]
MEAVIYICHGSRLDEAKKESYALIDLVKKEVPVAIQETCFLELQEPDLHATVQQVIKKGATKIYVMPILLLTAGHAKKDIPTMIKKEENNYPDVEFVYGRAIEVDERMIGVLVERVNQATNDIEEMEILLVGRGSSDLSAVHDTEELATLLRRHFPGNAIEKCFLAASEPKFEPLLQAKVAQGKSLLVLPYLLFTGLLDKGIKEFIQSLALQTGQQVLLADYLGHHHHVVDILADRVKEAREGASQHATMVEGSS